MKYSVLRTRVKILRDGFDAGTFNIADVKKDDIVKLMVGREIKDMYPKIKVPIGNTVLEIKGLNGNKLKDINIRVKCGRDCIRIWANG